MRKKLLFSMLLSIVLVFSMAAVAFADYCMNCGTELPSGANYCYSCGAKQSGGSTSSGSSSSGASVSTSGLKITGITNNGDGTVTIRWNDSAADSPYTVYSLQKFTNNFDSDLNADVGVFICTENVTSRMTVLDSLVPGQDYWLIVEDSDGDYVYKDYDGGSLPRFYEFNTDISIQLKYRRNNAYEEVTSFSASDFNRNRANTTYGAYIRLDYPQLARARQYRYMVSITNPAGDVVTDSLGDMDLSRGRSYTYWTYYSLDWYLGLMADNYGTLPLGTYTWSLYYDGLFVGSQTFRVTN